MFPMDMRSIMESLATQDLVVGLVLAGAGLVFVILGVRIYQALVAITFGTLGFFIGANLPIDGPFQLLAGIIAATSFGLIGGKFARVGVAILGGGWSAMIAAALLRYFHVDEHVVMALAVLAFGATLSLTFVMFTEITAFVTSLEGAMLLTAAIIVCISGSPSYWAHVRGLLTESFFGPFLVLSGTVTGYYLQMADWRQKGAGASV
jgi:hypothetical protein